jgi:hypothetical protein
LHYPDHTAYRTAGPLGKRMINCIDISHECASRSALRYACYAYLPRRQPISARVRLDSIAAPGGSPSS